MNVPHIELPERADGVEAVAPAQPFVFDGLAGFFHAAAGDTAILLLSPWGYEELCSRKTYRILGEMLAARGYPTLRFDYPATGNSLGQSAELGDERAWRDATRRALEELRTLSAASRVIVIGQGIGGALAADLASETEMAGLVLLGPVSQGRGYLRELAAWTAMTKPTFLVDASDGPQGGLMAGGFVLSAATANEFRALNILKAPAPRASQILLVERPQSPRRCQTGRQPSRARRLHRPPALRGLCRLRVQSDALHRAGFNAGQRRLLDRGAVSRSGSDASPRHAVAAGDIERTGLRADAGAVRPRRHVLRSLHAKYRTAVEDGLPFPQFGP